MKNVQPLIKMSPKQTFSYRLHIITYIIHNIHTYFEMSIQILYYVNEYEYLLLCKH